MQTLRTETAAGVRHIVLSRGESYNTITPELRDELAAAIDDADADRAVRVILLRAEGPAFCAGYGLDWSTRAQAGERAPADGARSASVGPRPWAPDRGLGVASEASGRRKRRRRAAQLLLLTPPRAARRSRAEIGSGTRSPTCA